MNERLMVSCYDAGIPGLIVRIVALDKNGRRTRLAEASVLRSEDVPALRAWCRRMHIEDANAVIKVAGVAMPQ